MWVYAYQQAIGLDHLRLIEAPMPEPGPRDILVEMCAASLNYRDRAIAAGCYHVDVRAPLIPLSDGAGRVVHCGSDVRRFASGDIVCPLYLPDWHDGPVTPQKAARRLGGPDHGVYRQWLCLNEEEAVHAPRHLDAVEAATLPVAALTAWHTLFAQGGLQPGMVLLVQGVGGVASFAIQFGKVAGARVIALLRDEKGAPIVRMLGADDVLVTPQPKDWPSEVRRIAPDGVDRIFDISGQNITASIACCRAEALVHLVGYSGGLAAELDLFTAIRHAVTLRAASAGNRGSFKQMVLAMESASLRPHISASFARNQFIEALAAFGRPGRPGKIVIDLTKAAHSAANSGRV